MKAEEKLVSILVPTFNRAKYIEECINSAVNQTYSNVEIIVVDNKSNDETVSIVARIAKADRRVKLHVNSENLGPVRNWRECLKLSRGDYIKFLFSDDMLEPDCIEKCMSILADKNKCSAVVTDAWICNSYGTKLFIKDFTTKIGNSNLLLLEHFLLDVGLPVSPGCALFKRHVFENNTIFSDSSRFCSENPLQHGVGPDLKIFLSSACYGGIVSLSQPLNIFREHNESISVKLNKKRLIMLYNIARLEFTNSLDDVHFFQMAVGRLFFDRLIYGTRAVHCFQVPMKDFFTYVGMKAFIYRCLKVLKAKIERLQ